MKRFASRAALAGLLLFGLVALFILRIAKEAFAPRFIPAKSRPTFGPYRLLWYQKLALSPFEGGKMWIMTSAGTNGYRFVLYDIDHRVVLGELTHDANPVFMNQDQSRVLCLQRVPGARSLKAEVLRFYTWMTRNKFSSSQPPGDVERVWVEKFWVVSLNGESATRIGELDQMEGAGSAFVSSPDFRYGYSYVLNEGTKDKGIFLCDLEQKKFWNAGLDGWPAGWWNATSIVIKDPKNNLILYDVVSRKTSVLVSAGQITRFLNDAQISETDVSGANLFCVWNGHEDDFYLTDTREMSESAVSFLAKVEKPKAKLKLLLREFKFEWSGHFDPTGTYYLFNGESGQTSSGVFLRNMTNGTTTTLVEPDGSRDFSIPRFYRETVIYMRNNELWQVDVNGSKQSRLFPPP
jgi:hypothetical protein